MVLVDTSVWIDHFRRNLVPLARLLDDGFVVTHPAVIGELACGTLRQRATTLDLLGRLRSSSIASDLEVLGFLEMHRLCGRGLGWIDVHLLAAASLTSCRLWTRDQRLEQAARTLGLAFEA